MLTPNVDVLRSAIGPMLTEHGTVTYDTGTTEQDEDTGLEVPVYETVYTGPMLVRPQADTLRTASVAGQSFPVLKFEVTLPAESPAVIGHIVTLTTCPWSPDLVGLKLSLVDVPLDSWQVARFCMAERLPL